MKSSLWIFLVLLSLTGCSTKGVYTPLSIEAISEFEAQGGEKHSTSSKRLYHLLKNAHSKEEADHYAYLLKKELEIENYEQKIAILRKKIALLQKRKQDLKRATLLNTISEDSEIDRSEEAEERGRVEEVTLDIKKSIDAYTITVKEDYFKPESFDLKREYLHALDRFIAMLREQDNDATIVLKVDRFGDSLDSIDKAIKRVNQMKRVLIEKGIDPSRVKIKRYNINDLIKG